jgi:hypothetical protein
MNMAICDVHVSKNKTRAIKTTNRHMAYMHNVNVYDISLLDVKLYLKKKVLKNYDGILKTW